MLAAALQFLSKSICPETADAPKSVLAVSSIDSGVVVSQAECLVQIGEMISLIHLLVDAAAASSCEHMVIFCLCGDG